MPIMVSTMSPNMCKLCPRSIHTRRGVRRYKPDALVTDRPETWVTHWAKIGRPISKYVLHWKHSSRSQTQSLHTPSRIMLAEPREALSNRIKTLTPSPLASLAGTPLRRAQDRPRTRQSPNNKCCQRLSKPLPPPDFVRRRLPRSRFRPCPPAPWDRPQREYRS